VVPALDMQELLTTTAELANEGKVLRPGMPKPLHLALFVRRFCREVRAPFPPAPVVQAALAPLAALGRPPRPRRPLRVRVSELPGTPGTQTARQWRAVGKGSCEWA
jgi:hypothetical protein